MIEFSSKQFFQFGRGCGAVGKTVASDTKGPLFESQQPQKVQMQTVNRIT